MHQITTKLPAIHLTVKKPDILTDKVTTNQPESFKAGKTMHVTSDPLKKEKSFSTQKTRVDSHTTKLSPKVPEVEVPVYVTSRRNRAFSQKNEEELMITRIPLPTKYFSPAYWVRRNIAITIYSDEND